MVNEEMKNIVFVNKEEHRKIHMRENYMTEEEERTKKTLTALETIKEICGEQLDDECEKCPFYDRSDGCLIKEFSPNCWEIGKFENGKLLR